MLLYIKMTLVFYLFAPYTGMRYSGFREFYIIYHRSPW